MNSVTKFVPRSTACLLLGAALGMGCRVKPQAPQLADVAPAPITLPPSRAELHVHVPMQRVLEEAEREVPKEFGAKNYDQAINGGADHCCEGGQPAAGVSAGWALSRGPLAMTLEGSAVHVGVDVLYDLEGRTQTPCCDAQCSAQCVAPAFSGSCGRHGEARRKAHLALTSLLELRPDWTLHTQTSAQLTPQSRCQVSMLKIDITDQVMSAAQTSLAGACKKIDHAVAALPTRQKIEEAWRTLQRPISLGEGVWLDPGIDAAFVQPLQQVGDELVTGLSLRATPRVTVGASAPETAVRPLPAAQEGAVGDGFYVAMPVDLSFAEATRQLRNALNVGAGGTPIQVGRRQLQIRDIEISGSGTTAVVRVVFDGSQSGTMYLVGNPVYDASTHVLSVPDLDFSLESKTTLLKAANWIAHSRLRKDIADGVRFDLGPLVGQARAALNGALNRKIGPIQLSGGMTDLRILSVGALPSQQVFRTQVVFSGSLRAEVH